MWDGGCKMNEIMQGLQKMNDLCHCIIGLWIMHEFYIIKSCILLPVFS